VLLTKGAIVGTYDTYEDIQIKAGSVYDDMRHFKIGDHVPIADGIYIGYGGAIVIMNGIFLDIVETVYDKYGAPIDLTELVNARNPLAMAVEETIAELEDGSDHR
jgi:hypothetical protein